MSRRFGPRRRNRKWTKTFLCPGMFELLFAFAMLNTINLGLSLIRSLGNQADDRQPGKVDLRDHLTLAFRHIGNKTSSAFAIEERMPGGGGVGRRVYQFTAVPCSDEITDNSIPLCNAICFPYKAECLNNENSIESDGSALNYCACFLEQLPPFNIGNNPCQSSYIGYYGADNENDCFVKCPKETTVGKCRPRRSLGLNECVCLVNSFAFSLVDAHEYVRHLIPCRRKLSIDGHKIEACKLLCPNAKERMCQEEDFPELNRPTLQCNCLIAHATTERHAIIYPLDEFNRLYPPTLDACSKNVRHDDPDRLNKLTANCKKACPELDEGICCHLRLANEDPRDQLNMYCICKNKIATGSSLVYPPDLMIGHGHSPLKHHNPCHSSEHGFWHGECHGLCLHGTIGTCWHFKEKVTHLNEEGIFHDHHIAQCLCRFKMARSFMTLPITRQMLPGVPSNSEFKIPPVWNGAINVCLIVCYPYTVDSNYPSHCVCSVKLNYVDLNPCINTSAEPKTLQQLQSDCNDACHEELSGICELGEHGLQECFCAKAEDNELVIALRDNFMITRHDVLCTPDSKLSPLMPYRDRVLCSSACPTLLPALCTKVSLPVDHENENTIEECLCRIPGETPDSDKYIPLIDANIKYPPTNDLCANFAPHAGKAACKAACPMRYKGGGNCYRLTLDTHFHILTYCYCIISVPIFGTDLSRDLFLTPTEAVDYLLKLDGNNSANHDNPPSDACFDNIDNRETESSDCRPRCPPETHAYCLSIVDDPNVGHCFCFSPDAIRGWTLSVALDLFEDRNLKEQRKRAIRRQDPCSDDFYGTK